MNQQIRDHFYGQGAANRLLAPDAIINYNARPSYLSQVGWTAPVTNRLLFEGGLSLANKDFHYYPQPEVGPGPALLDREQRRASAGETWSTAAGSTPATTGTRGWSRPT